MKKLLSLLLLTLTLISCSNESKMKSNIVTYFEKTAKDPKSYESVEFKVIDTITVSGVAKEKIKLFQKNIDDNNKLLKELKKTKTFFSTIVGYDDDYLTMLDNQNEGPTAVNYQITTLGEVNDSVQVEINKYKEKVNDNTVLGYIAFHKFRIKNAFGALDLYEKYITFDTNFNVLEMVDNKNIIQSILLGQIKSTKPKLNKTTEVAIKTKDLINEFTKNEVSTKLKYIQTSVLITGKITSINDDEIILDEMVVCYLKNNTKLKIGQNVKIKGKITEFDDLLGEITLKYCSI